jgi:putative nucleotidyltransferase with HDIG domain
MAYPEAHSSDKDSAWSPLSRRLAAALVTRFNSPFYRPPVLPPVATQLIDIARQDEPDLDLVLGLLQNDALLAARILRLSQSPLYRPVEPVRTLREAVVRLGVNRIRDFVVAEVLHLRVFRASPFRPLMDRLRVHSLAVAQVSEAVARAVDVHAEEAFLCGLLHDIGVAGLVHASTDDSRLQGWMSPAVALPVIDELHPAAGAIMASMWALPESVHRVVSRHHRGDAEPLRSSLAAVVCVADALASELGCGLHDPDDASTSYLHDRTPESVRTEAEFFLGLGRRDMESLRADASDLVESVREFG